MVSPAIISPVADIDLLITDGGITEDVTKAFVQSGIRVLTV
jgi:DeoR/GlpR family transcriptional regulator of sugar metabolism